jgi:hypothetical protein
MLAESQNIGTRRGGHCLAMNEHATLEELLEVVFSMWFAVRQYSKDQREKLVKWGQSWRLIHKLQASSGSTWLAVRSLHC